jgi:hypothetical protein
MRDSASIERPIKAIFLAYAVAIAFLTPTSSFAEGPVIRSGETVTVEANQVLEGDFYAIGQTISLSGASEHDVYVAGGAITINAPVAEDLVILGGVVQVHGDVADDVRIVGGEVVIANPVADDVVVLGGTVHILSTATIGGDLIFFGGDVRVDGDITGALYGTGERVRIDAHVGGDVTVRAGDSLTLGDAADVAGNIAYKSRNELIRAQSAVVSGSITRETLIQKSSMTDTQGIVLSVLVLIFSSLSVFFIARSRIERLVTDAWVLYGRSGLIGLGMMLAIPLVAVILMASIIGAVVGIGLLFLYMVVLVATCMSLPIFIGAFFGRLMRKGARLTLFTVMFGVLLTTVLPFIPVLGMFVLFLAFLVIFGTFCLELYRMFRGD